LNTEESAGKTDQSLEFAKERTYLASENTMMAWVRTSLTLIGFGVGIFEAFEKSGGKGTFRNSRLVAMGMVLLGVAALFLAINQRIETKRELSQDHFVFNNKRSIAIRVGYGLIIIGIIGLIHIVISLFFS